MRGRPPNGRLGCELKLCGHPGQRHDDLVATAKEPVASIGFLRDTSDEDGERGDQLVERHLVDDQSRVDPLARFAPGHVIVLPRYRTDAEASKTNLPPPA